MRFWAVFASVLCVSTGAAAQEREPLCVTVESRRLVSAPYLQANGSDRIVASALPAAGANGAAFVIAARDPDHSLRVGDARALPRSLREMGWSTPAPTPDRQPGITVLRVGRDLAVVGDGVFLPDPVRGERGEETFPPGIPVGATVDAGVLVIEHVAGDLYATVVGATGEVPAPQRVASAPEAVNASAHRGYVWLTALSRTRDGHREAVALAGTDAGEVTALRFDAQGALTGAPVRWQQRVGGRMQLVPSPEGAGILAVLERPVRGTAITGEQAREQVLVRVSEALVPVGEPERLGLGPYETVGVVRGRSLVLTQWAEARGLAVATLTPRDGEVSVETPHIWTTQPLEGVALGHSITRAPGNILYDFMLHGDDVAGGLHAYLTYIPPGGVPFARRDVVPWRARVIAPPMLLPAEDGVVAVMASYDELGGGIDAVHVRCDLLTLPRR